MGDEEGRKVGAERSEGGGGEVDRLREVRCPWKIGNGLPGPDILLRLNGRCITFIYMLCFLSGYASYCPKCKKKTKNMTTETFFETTRIKFEDFFVLLWLWASDASTKVVRNTTNFTKVQVIQYYRNFR